MTCWRSSLSSFSSLRSPLSLFWTGGVIGTFIPFCLCLPSLCFCSTRLLLHVSVCFRPPHGNEGREEDAVALASSVKMHIKKLVLCGFKSYKEKVVVDDLHEKVNIIVGRNGSGKSNLFAAIEFALTLEYRCLRSTDRSALLYQGQQQQDPAYVEIVFDNSDKKLPVEGDTDTVTFRRVLATKKDKFFVNGKELSNARQFLDVAGFTNPYFIVKQGKVNQLAVGSDEIRLKLLQDVAGSSEYDSRINNFKNCLRDGQVKAIEIQQTLNRLMEKKKLLEQEADELKEYVKVDKIRRAIEYVIHTREVHAVSDQVSKCAEEREQLKKKQDPFKIKLVKKQKEHEAIETEIATVRQSIRTNEDTKEAIQNEVLGLVSDIEKLKNQRKDLENKADSEFSSLSEELNNLVSECQDQEEFIVRKTAVLTKLKKEENKVFSEFVKIEADLKEMENSFLFQDRDKKSLSKELKDIEKNLKDDSEREAETNKEANKLKEFMNELFSNAVAKESELDAVRTELKRLEHSEDVRSFVESKRAQSEMWRKLNEIEQTICKEKEKHSAIMDQFRRRASREVMDGWEGVKRVLKTFEDQGGKNHVLEGYYGSVIENIDNDEMFDRAVETAIGRKLYHHIVKDTSIGMEILSEFNRQGLKGEVNFIPLSKINPAQSQPVPEDDRNYRLLLSEVKFPLELAKVGEYLFGKYLVAKSLEYAVYASKSHKWNCVTTDGDKVEKSGLMKGGFYQSRLSPLELFRNKSQSEKFLDQEKKKKCEIESKLNILAANVAKRIKKIEAVDTKKSSCRLERERLTTERKILLDKIKHTEISLQLLSRKQDSLKKSQIELKCIKNAIQKMTSGDPVYRTNTTMKEAENKRKRLKELGAQRSSILNDINDIESSLGKAKLAKQRLSEKIQDEKNKQCDRMSHTQRESLFENLDSTIHDLELRLTSKQEEITVIVGTINNLKNKLGPLEENSSKLGDDKLKIEMELVKLTKEMEGAMSTHLSFERKLKELKEKTSNFASIPSVVDKYSAIESKELYVKLKKIKSKTSDNDGVNQKAFEQYEEINKNYEEFSSKMEKLEVEKNALYECIEDLEERRGQAAYKCFVMLQEQFQEIFSKIVPAGKAELVLYGDSVEVTSRNMKDPKIQSEFGRHGFLGLKINVNFIKPQLSELKNLMSLSGGQKAVVALSLILAVQKIEPVPFYLFDEVDQALDSQYRGAVSEVIQSMSSDFNLQFICTTFRKEFLHGADKVYGVSYANKVSTVRSISATDASDFVESESSPASSGQQHINFSQNMSFVL